MTALAKDMMVSYERWRNKQLPLGPAKKAYKGGTAIGDPSTGTVVPGAVATGKLFLGIFAEQIDNTGSTNTTALVNVDFIYERTVLWRDNDGSITSANLFSPCYVVDDHTVGASSSGKSAAGTIVAVDTTLGVGFVVGGF
jgi:hypothetical protein